MNTLKRHSDERVSCSGEIRFGSFETSSSKDVEEEIESYFKILKDMSKTFHRTTNNEVKKPAFEVAQEKGIVT